MSSSSHMALGTRAIIEWISAESRALGVEGS